MRTGHADRGRGQGKVSQDLGSPAEKPVVNHWVRCCEEPCVNLDSSTGPPIFFWMVSSPTAAAASSAWAMSAPVTEVKIGCPLVSVVCVACLAQTPEQQSACSSSATESWAWLARNG